MKTLLTLLMFAASAARAGLYYDLRQNVSSATLRVGASGVTPNDAILVSSGAAVVQSTSAVSAHKPFRVKNNAGSEILSVTQGGVVAAATAVVTYVQASSITTTGNVNVQGDLGIGTAAPATKIDVNGNLQWGSGATKSTGTTAGSLIFNHASANPAYARGTLFFDDIEDAVSYYNSEADITMNLGQENWVRVRNNSGSTILNGKVVYINGAIADKPTIALAKADVSSTTRVLGIATHDIENNTNGYITSFGVVHDLNTSGLAAGTSIFLSAVTAGEFTATAPNSPNLSVFVGFITRSNPVNGAILVNIDRANFGVIAAGAIPFGGDGAILRADENDLFWDNTNKRLGVGTPTPETKVHITDGSTFKFNYFGSSVALSANSNPGIIMRRFAGTVGAPTAISNGVVMGAVAATGHDGTEFPTSAASISFASSGAYTSGSHGSFINFNTTPIGSVTLAARARITDVGNFGLGTTVPATTLDVNGNAQFGQVKKATFTVSGGLELPYGVSASTAVITYVQASSITLTSGATIYGNLTLKNSIELVQNKALNWEGTTISCTAAGDCDIRAGSPNSLRNDYLSSIGNVLMSIVEKSQAIVMSNTPNVDPTAAFVWKSSNTTSEIMRLLNSADEEKLRVSNTGRLGLNTAVGGPSSLLHMSSGTLTVDGTGAKIVVPYVEASSITTTGGLNALGSLGIGTIAPATKLHMSSGTLLIDGNGAGIKLNANGGIATSGQSFIDLTSAGQGVAAQEYIGMAAADSIGYNASNSHSFSISGNLRLAVTDAAVNLGVGADTNVNIGAGANAITKIASASNGKVGIGTTGDPATKLHLSSGTLTIDGNVVNTIVASGHIVSTGTTPSIVCNVGTPTMAADSNDMSGQFVAGTAAANCTLTFANAFTKKPRCWCNDESQVVTVRAVSTVTTLKCDVAVAFGGDTITYGCQGAP